MICYILLVVFALFLVGVILMPHLRSNTVLGGALTRPDPNNCANYYNRLGFLKSCPMDDRYDATRAVCDNFFLVDCQSRPNRPRHAVELCSDFWHYGDIEVSVFASDVCNEYFQCALNDMVILRRVCPPQTSFDVRTKQCLPDEAVECGARVVQQQL